MTDDRISLNEAARLSGVSASTLNRWAAEKVIPVKRGRWTTAAAAQARVVARLRERGHSLDELRRAVREGRLAFGYVEELLPGRREQVVDRAEAAERTGLEEELIERVMTLLGTPTALEGTLNEQDVAAIEDMAAVLDAGLPLVALLQLVRVYAQSIRKIAEAEVRLFHLYVHEPLIRQGVEALEMAEEMEGLARELLPLTSPLMEYIHQRYLRFYIEQDVVGHMEADFADLRQLDRVQLAFCFVDLTGFVRYTEEEGDEEALDLVERFVETVEATLPSEALIVKTIGDEVMIVSPDPVSLTEWAAGFLTLFSERPKPRVGIHYGGAVYRDGDYFGTDVNLTHRVVARALAGEVMVTTAVRDAIGDTAYLRFDPIGRVGLKGFLEPVELFSVRAGEDQTGDRRRRQTWSRSGRGGQESACIRRKIASVGSARKDEALSELAAAARASGLLDSSTDAVVMVSGGADSAGAAAALTLELGAEQVHALHVNYGLRASAAEGELAARRLCAALRIDLHLERPQTPLAGNLQAAARRVRYDAAERLRARAGADLIATGHTRTDLAETLLYRLASSPGSRALLGLAPRAGRVVRPLLALDRAQLRGLVEAAGLPFADDETNRDPTFARNRIRAEVLPVLGEINHAAQRNIAETRAELAEEAAVLERAVLEALARAGAGAGAVAITAEALTSFEPGLRRLALRALAERAAGRAVALGRARASEITRLAGEPEGGSVELGGGVVARCESGFVRFDAGALDAAPEPALSACPGGRRSANGKCAPSSIPGPSIPPARISQRSTPRPWPDGSRSGPGARETGSGRSG